MMKWLILALVLNACTHAYDQFDQESSDAMDSDAMDDAMPMAMPSAAQKPVQSLMAAVKKLHKQAPLSLKEHTRIMKHHASLIEDHKAKAYSHNLKTAKAAINAALRSLNGELLTGHRHDSNLLKNAKRRGVSTVSSATSRGKTKVKHFKSKSCPLKRREEQAGVAKRKALQKEQRLENSKTCPLRTTMADMNIHKSNPILGSELRNKWYKVKAQWNKVHLAYVRAKKAHQTAILRVNKAMASFKTSLRIEASNTNRACRQMTAEFNALKKDVATNVATRKQVHVAALVVKCYVNHLANNRAAQKCADRAHKANTSIWNINGGKLAPCTSVGSLTSSFGPARWSPSKHNCKHNRL